VKVITAAGQLREAVPQSHNRRIADAKDASESLLLFQLGGPVYDHRVVDRFAACTSFRRMLAIGTDGVVDT